MALSQDSVYHIRIAIFSLINNQDCFEMVVKDAVRNWKRCDQKALAELIAVFMHENDINKFTCKRKCRLYIEI